KLSGTDGAIWASWSGATDRTFEPAFSLRVQSGETLSDVPLDRPSGEVFELVAQVEAVTRAIRSHTAPPCTGDDGLWSVAMCLKAAESLAAGSPVTLSSLGSKTQRR